MDHANDRSLHVGTVPRIGGLAMVAGVVAGVATIPSVPGMLQVVLLAAVGLCAISLLDDLRPLPVIPRLLGHLTAATLAVWMLQVPVHLAVPAIVALAWMTNLYNFMDGADGLAGGMTAIGFGAYCVAGLGVAPDLATVCLLIAGAACAFLLFNFPPAKVFLGDAGSIPLGFLAGAIGLQGWQAGVWSWWFPMLVFSPFIADATVTLWRRLYGREPVWQAHKDHYYQRLILAGWTHRRLTRVAWLLMVAAASSAFPLQRLDPLGQIAGIVAWLLVFGGVFLAIERYWRRVRKRAP